MKAVPVRHIRQSISNQGQRITDIFRLEKTLKVLESSSALPSPWTG